MYVSIDTIQKTDAVLLRTTLLLKAALTCDGLENAGIPARLFSDPIAYRERFCRSSDEYIVLVPHERLAQARELLES